MVLVSLERLKNSVDPVTARVRYKREIGREKKKKSTFDLTTDNGACLRYLPQISPFTLDVTTNKYL